MKKVIFTIGMVLASISVNAQLVVKETTKDSVVWNNKLQGLPKLMVFYTDTESEYTMYYLNAKYSTLKDVRYMSIGDKETCLQFFQILNKVIEENKDMTIQLGDETYLLSKSMGSSVTIWHTLGYFYLSKKQIDAIITNLNK